MVLFLILGIVFVLFSFLTLFAPATLLRITKVADTVIPFNQMIFKHRFIVGVFLLISALVMYWVASSLSGLRSLLATASAILGGIYFVFAALLFFAPRLVEQISEVGDRVIIADKLIVAYRRQTGVGLLVLALFMFYVYYASLG